VRYDLSPNATPAEKLFHAADAHWFQKLREKFGDRANAARFLYEGTGQPGTELRAAHTAYCTARDAWLDEVERENTNVRQHLAGAKLRSEHMVERARRIAS
jgi:hypothetical protein